MKILLLHSDFIEWEPKKKALKTVEDVEKKPNRVDDVLVVLSAAEKEDEKNPKGIARRTAEEIINVQQQVKAKNIVVYPYAHLSSDLAKPSSALDILRGIESELKKKDLSVFRAPFGWYKAFSLKCKGHPLAELSKHISFEKHTETIKPEEDVPSLTT